MVLVDSQIISRLHELVDIYKSDSVSVDSLLSQVNPNSIDLTIGKEYKRPNALKRIPVVYGFSCKEEQDLYNLAYWTDYKADDGYITLKPGEIILGVTREYVTMPEDMCGQLFTKSTLGRMFINHMMAGVVDAGFYGRLTLELKNEGAHTIKIPIGSRVVQMICYGLYTPPERSYSVLSRKSRYNGATTIETAKMSQNR